MDVLPEASVRRSRAQRLATPATGDVDGVANNIRKVHTTCTSKELKDLNVAPCIIACIHPSLQAFILVGQLLGGFLSVRRNKALTAWALCLVAAHPASAPCATLCVTL
jgi:hypothetical protein